MRSCLLFAPGCQHRTLPALSSDPECIIFCCYGWQNCIWLMYRGHTLLWRSAPSPRLHPLYRSCTQMPDNITITETSGSHESPRQVSGRGTVLGNTEERIASKVLAGSHRIEFSFRCTAPILCACALHRISEDTARDACWVCSRVALSHNAHAHTHTHTHTHTPETEDGKGKPWQAARSVCWAPPHTKRRPRWQKNGRSTF